VNPRANAGHSVGKVKSLISDNCSILCQLILFDPEEAEMSQPENAATSSTKTKRPYVKEALSTSENSRRCGQKTHA
jgi:hypothetical protein